MISFEFWITFSTPIANNNKQHIADHNHGKVPKFTGLKRKGKRKIQNFNTYCVNSMVAFRPKVHTVLSTASVGADAESYSEKNKIRMIRSSNQIEKAPNTKKKSIKDNKHTI